ncbi:MAG: hypothetical protein ABSB25_04325 [Sedimentisphaerales bacterium]
MKALFWLSLVVSILLPISLFGFNLFAFGGCVIPGVTQLMALICVLALIIVIPVSPFILLVDLIAVIYLWRRHRTHSFLPLAIITTGFLVTIPLIWLAHSLCDKRFERHLTQYEQAVSVIEANPASDFRFERPDGWTNLAIAPPITFREGDGTLTVEFLVGGIGPPPRHILYIYRSNGLIDKDSKTANYWRHTTKVNEHWFCASD